MDIIQISDEIMHRIKLLQEGRKLIASRSEEKATAISNYDKKLSITIVKIRNGEDVGLTLKDPLPVTLIDKVAKGLCSDEKLSMERADGFYRAAVSGMSSLEAELNGLQSIFRYLKDV